MMSVAKIMVFGVLMPATFLRRVGRRANPSETSEQTYHPTRCEIQKGPLFGRRKTFRCDRAVNFG
jgi:hypothetical protein